MYIYGLKTHPVEIKELELFKVCVPYWYLFYRKKFYPGTGHEGLEG
jgi:hypothetical protein